MARPPARAPDPGRLAVLLRAHRERALLTQERLAERAGISVRALRELERGRARRPRADTVQALAGALGLDDAALAELAAAARGELREPGAPDAPPGTTAAGETERPAFAAQLPPSIDDFTGREELLRDSTALLRAAGSGQAVMVVTVTGQAGVGKTTFAVRAAHQLAADFPDGQLYVDLHGAQAEPADPADVLAGFLRALGVEGGAIPETTEERARFYRARLAGRRLLVLLDNAFDEGQLRPLLPGSGGCAALVTSRNPLAGIEAAQRVVLPVLPAADALRLLRRVAGAERVDADPEAARRVVELCGCLPLAVRVAGAKLATRPHWSVAWLLRRLEDEHQRLDELAVGDLQVRASVSLSYLGAGAEERRLFRALGRLWTLPAAAWQAAALLGVPERRAEALLDRLVDAQLLLPSGSDQAGQLRYRLHDILAVLARERLQLEDSPEERFSALERLLEAAAERAEDAAARLSPGEFHHAGRRDPPAPARAAGHGHPLCFFDAEQEVLLALLWQADEAGLWRHVVRLGAALAGYLEARALWSRGRQVNRLVLAAGRRHGDLAAQALALRNLAAVNRETGRFDEATRQFRRALTLARRTGDRFGEAAVLNGFGMVHLHRGLLGRSGAMLERSVEIFTELGDDQGRALALRRLGLLRRNQGREREAVAILEEALGLYRRLDDPRGTAFSLGNLGTVRHNQGRLEAAVADHREALALFEWLGDRRGTAISLRGLGDALRARGRLDEAGDALERSVALAAELGEPLLETAVLHGLGEVRHDQGRLNEAVACYRRCLPVVREHGDHYGEAAVLLGLGRSYRRMGRLVQAVDLLSSAVALFERLGFRRDAARALEDLTAARREHERQRQRQRRA